MPSFEFLDKVELFVRTGTHPVDASKSSKKVTRAASKKFIYQDGRLWRTYRGRLLRVVRNNEEIREILIRYHDNNNHAGRVRTVKEIMMMYYWVGVTESVKNWIKNCTGCQRQAPAKRADPPVQFCLAYGCDASSYVYPELTFHRFPKEAERRRRWLAVAQRDEGSLRSRSCLCSRHFEPSCFTLNEEGQMILSPDAVPTIIPVTAQEQEGPATSDEDFLHSKSLEEILHTAATDAAASRNTSTDLALDQSPTEMQEHQYSLPPPDQDSTSVQALKVYKKRQTVIESSFATYNQIARYLSHRVLPMQSKIKRGSLKRMAKRFALIDGVLMFTRVSPPLRVPRSREEVNSILTQFHDNQGHYSQGICQKEIMKHFYWATMSRDLARWISSCNTCINRTKRKWLRCSIQNCTNCCGPVERGLGLTFHKFPLHNMALLSQWLKAVGRSNWHPRLWSSVCSVHFTEDCFDRGGDKVVLHPDAVPTLLVHSDSVVSSNGPVQSVMDECAYFAKYDAVDLYLRRHTYPPGLSYVEKNTFRRFCKQFVIKDDELHIMRGDRVRLVLRNRQQVENALVDYHNELNHLDVNKCLRLLNERYFWKTMRSDVVKWINSCSQCSLKKRPKPNNRSGGGSSLKELRSPQLHDDFDSGRDDDDYSPDEEDVVGNEERQPATNSDNRVQPGTPVSTKPRIPILLHLKAPVNLQPKHPVIYHQKNNNTRYVTKIWSIKKATPTQPEVQTETNSSENSDQVPPEGETQTQDQNKTKSCQGSARTHYVQVQVISEPNAESDELPATPGTPDNISNQTSPPSQSKRLKTKSKAQIVAPKQTQGAVQRAKRKVDLDGGSSAKKSFSGGAEPVKSPNSDLWPVFTISDSKLPTDMDSPAPTRRPRKLRARIIIQQCSQAKVKIKPALDGAEAQWAEIQEGMVVYVSFFQGAAEDVIHEMANTLMTTKLFRKDTRHLVSILDLPGSVLFVPQDSLVGEPSSKRRMQYKDGCEPWWGAQLFSILVSTCRELMLGSNKSMNASVKLEQGIYGQKQEIVLNSMEPLTVLLEF
ncbi:uncharacterized protein LOC121526129 [Cheilinus undulatus]|uniref:uncharacterized protein LOC121526129 n=1 Tax=Cheilinus undulatus TaxID=241271 RepID=UPI001BD5560B|nr:uncharacterized protein LOC121526129 [Cheilinus undulatus]